MSLGMCCRYIGATLSDTKASVANRMWTPVDLMLSGFAWTGMLVAVAINFSLNGLLQWQLNKGNDFVGAFYDLTNSTNIPAGIIPPAGAELVTVTSPGQGYAAIDMLIGTCLVTFFTNLGSVGGRGKVKDGAANPIDPAAVAALQRVFPAVGQSHVFVRAGISTVQMLLTYYLFSRLALGAICGAGALPHDSATGVCVLPLRWFVWFKGAWAVTLALCAWPAATVGTLRADHLPADVLKAFNDRISGAAAPAVAPDGAAATAPASPAADAGVAGDDVVGADTRSRRNGSAPMPQALKQRRA